MQYPLHNKELDIALTPLPDSPEFRKIQALKKAIQFCVRAITQNPDAMGGVPQKIYYWDRLLNSHELPDWTVRLILGKDSIVKYHRYSEPGDPLLKDVYTNFYEFLIVHLPRSRNLPSILASEKIEAIRKYLFGDYSHTPLPAESAILGSWLTSYERDRRYTCAPNTLLVTTPDSAVQLNYSIYAIGQRIVSVKTVPIERAPSFEYQLFFSDNYHYAYVVVIEQDAASLHISIRHEKWFKVDDA